MTRNKETERQFEDWMIGVDNRCYDDKQAQYDYDGATAEDEDSADWFKPKYSGKAKKLG